MSKNNFLKFAIVSGVLLFGLAGGCFIAQAQTPASTTGGTVTLEPPIKTSGGGGAGIADIIGNVTGVIFWLGLMICPIAIIWGGFEIATAAGDSTKMTHGKQIIYYSIGGLAIIALSAVLVEMIKSIL